MSDSRELFPILQTSDKQGAGWDLRTVGSAVNSAQEGPVLTVEDSSNNLYHIPMRAAGEDVTSGIPNLTCADNSGDLQYIPLDLKGDAPGNSLPALVATDNAGNLTFVPVKQAGDNVADAIPVLTVKDKLGDLQYLDEVSEGDVIGDALSVIAGKDTAGIYAYIPIAEAGDTPWSAVPVMPFLDSVGKLAYVQLTSDGKVPVTTEATGQGKFKSGVHTPVALDTEYTVVDLALVKGKEYKHIQVSGSSMFSTLFRAVWVSDEGGVGETVTELARFLVGPGDFAHEIDMDNIYFTANNVVGAEKLQLRAKQLFGKLSDMHGVVSALESD